MEGINLWEFIHKVTTLRGVLSDLGTAMNKERSRNAQLTDEINARIAYLHSLHRPIKELKQRLKDLEDADMSAAQRTKEIEEILKVSSVYITIVNWTFFPNKVNLHK